MVLKYNIKQRNNFSIEIDYIPSYLSAIKKKRE
jgi:hypothetical protein